MPRITLAGRTGWLLVVLMTPLTGCLPVEKKQSASEHHKESAMSDKKVNFKEVLWYAERAKAAYQTEAEIRRAFPQTVRVAQVAGTDVQYFVERFPEQKQQVVTVRGTDNFANFKQDAEYLPEWNSKLGIRVHRGFDSDTSKLYAELLPYLDKDMAVKVTGHSLGAAISTLLMMYLHQDGFQLGLSINFGQPKVTNNEGAKAWEFLPLLRVVDENDLVPLVPPTTLLDSLHGHYEHFGREVILLEAEYFVYLSQHQAMKNSLDSFWNNLGNESVNEHFMANYLKNIQPKLTKAIAVDYREREEFVPSS